MPERIDWLVHAVGQNTATNREQADVISRTEVLLEETRAAMVEIKARLAKLEEAAHAERIKSARQDGVRIGMAATGGGAFAMLAERVAQAVFGGS